MKKYNVLLVLALLLGSSFASHAKLILASDGSLVSDLSNASGVVLDINDSELLSGAYNVMVEGTAYDVQFIEGTYQSIFGDNPTFFANDLSSAFRFSVALSDQVFLDVPNYDFDSRPELTYGCDTISGNIYACLVITLYGSTSDTSLSYFNAPSGLMLLGARTENYNPNAFEVDDSFQYRGDSLFETTNSPANVYAQWSLASDRLSSVEVSSPGAFTIALLGGLLLLMRRVNAA
ncbi:hypothetical protein ACFO4O_02645 [Glaciecola siphonariae]|uniref:PEP-CTERM protein-sorting domain-containing protein n=1 Tax=Glaciecola siphonariae TaxID=521012 RepID=A0ABV9LRC7_9ALTE